jgi:hypothetical protein
MYRKIFSLFFLLSVVLLYSNFVSIFAEEHKLTKEESLSNPVLQEQDKFIYNDHGKKDPFGPPKIDSVESDGEDVLAGIRLEGIIWDEDSPIAIINGKVVGVTDEINGAKIIQIKQNEVVLEVNGEKMPLKLQTKLE